MPGRSSSGSVAQKAFLVMEKCWHIAVVFTIAITKFGVLFGIPGLQYKKGYFTSSVFSSNFC